MILFISTSLQDLLITIKYSAIVNLHNFHFTVARALGFSVFTRRLLATNLNTEINSSNHYNVFLLFVLHRPTVSTYHVTLYSQSIEA
jgi:hypothetical protein